MGQEVDRLTTAGVKIAEEQKPKKREKLKEVGASLTILVSCPHRNKVYTDGNSPREGLYPPPDAIIPTKTSQA